MTSDDVAGALRAASKLAAGKRARRRLRTDDRILDAIEEINRNHALVLIGDRALVLREHLDETRRQAISFMSPDTMRVWKANEKFHNGDRPQGIGSIWLEHPARRQYEGLHFAPGEDRAGWFNLWRGFDVEPRKGDPQKAFPTFLDHLRCNIAGCREDHFQWIVGWFAHMMQRPGERLGTALVLRGREGTGKTKVGEVFGSLISRHYLQVDSPRYIVGQFNSHLSNCLLLQADEGFWAGDRQAEGVLKSLITSSRQMIERKGIDPVSLRNLVRLLVTSNEDWVVPAGLEARRFAVFEVGDLAMQNAAYFAEIDREMAEGGREVLLGWLLDYDLTNVDLRKVPSTEALTEQKLMTIKPEVAWWRSRLLEGTPTAQHAKWEGIVPTKLLYGSYVAFAETLGVSRKLTDEQLGIKLRKLVPGSVDRVRRTVTVTDDQGTEFTRRAWCFTLPPLAECRRHFDQLIRSETAWEPDDPGG
jgi:hypothetical protein